MYIAPFKPEIDSLALGEYQKTFRQFFDWNVSENRPRYDLLGYDLLNCFISLINNFGNNFNEKYKELNYQNGLQSDFHFKKQSQFSVISTTNFIWENEKQNNVMRKISIVFLFFCFRLIYLHNPALKSRNIWNYSGISASMINFRHLSIRRCCWVTTEGLIFRYITEKNVGLQVELNYFQRGWKETDSIYSRRLNYIELPFMTHIYFGNKTRFFFNIGPKISYLLSENVLRNETVSSEKVEQVKSVENPFDYGICGGLGFMFKISKNVFQLDARANYSLSDIFSNSKTDYFDTSNNINVSLNLGWLWQVK